MNGQIPFYVVFLYTVLPIITGMLIPINFVPYLVRQKCSHPTIVSIAVTIPAILLVIGALKWLFSILA